MTSEIIDQLLISGKLGDGCIYKNNKNQPHYNISFVSINLDYLLYKRDILKNIVKVSNVRTQKSGYKKHSFSYTFSTYQHYKITEIATMTLKECINSLSKEGLILYYLDDGTYHQKKHFMHIYCNEFNVGEVNLLIDKIYELYPIKKCSFRWDKKKDGRKYPYIYIPVVTVKEFKKDIERFLIKNEIYSMLYKVGKTESTLNDHRNTL
ncbi:MAG: hypothetical protein H0Z24_05515 [Thermosipho sp. (in: Bacteria)]|nr:hypothetical protein [Thermosipho sp. (in: thermotogales)]